MRDFALRGGLVVSECAPRELLALAEARLREGRSTHVCTVNPEFVQLAASDLRYRAVLDAADLRTIDGVGIALAVWRRHGWRPQRLTGRHVVDLLAAWSADTGRPLMIVGASDASRRRVEALLAARGAAVRPGVSPVVAADGSGGPGPGGLPVGGAVLVALGAPKQEFWIARALAAGTPPNVFVGCGGAVDALSGASAHPPEAIARLGLEWLFRLVTDPRMRLGRQVRTLPAFVAHHLT